MKSIYEITVPVTSQEQADRLKAICVKYGLPIWDSGYAFSVAFPKLYFYYLSYFKDTKEFFVFVAINNIKPNKTPITESEFLLLAKEFKQ
jgi:hypothetical protein